MCTILNENSTATLQYVNLFSVRTGESPRKCEWLGFYVEY
jgi:hypothetical protein